MPKPQEEPSFDHLADARLDDEQQMRRLLGLLSQLHQREQDVFVICAWMELSYEDAALALDIPIGTVRSRLSRARQHLRELDPAFGHEKERTATVQEGLDP
jgi:RNA polymerase sigma-70 factor (ECF subfamily)